MPSSMYAPGPEEAQRLQRFWPLHHLAFKFLNLSIELTCHVMCSLHELLCTLLLLLLMGTIFSYFCMSSITSVLILAILIAIVLFL